jgi:hypothetical protein
MRHPDRENSNRTGPGIKRCKTCGQNGPNRPEEMYLRWRQILTIFVGWVLSHPGAYLLHLEGKWQPVGESNPSYQVENLVS